MGVTGEIGLQPALLRPLAFTSLAHIREALAKHRPAAQRDRQSGAGNLCQAQRYRDATGTGRCAHLRAPHTVPLHHRA
jgi:hypothetical protein